MYEIILKFIGFVLWFIVFTVTWFDNSRITKKLFFFTIIILLFVQACDLGISILEFIEKD